MVKCLFLLKIDFDLNFNYYIIIIMRFSNKMLQLVNSGGSIIYKALRKNNVTDMFIYSGGSVMPLIDSLYKSKINYFINTHEQNTGHSATGYAKSSNKTGVCMVTSGPGITNMITPILDAKNDSTPLVVFSGQVSQEAQGLNSFQEAPAVELTRQVTKWSYQITDIYEMESVVDEAFRIANDKKKGPVHIDIPKCVSYQDYNPSLSVNNFKQNIKQNMKDYKNKIQQVAAVINRSKKPIIIVGKGCSNATNYLTEFVNKSNIPVTSTIHGCGIYDENKELSLRWCGMHGSAAANYAIQDADLIIALGSRFDDRTTGKISEYAPEAFKASEQGRGGIIHVNIEESELDFVVNSDYNFDMDCELFLKQIMPHISYTKKNEWINNINNLKQTYPFVIKTDDTKLHMEDVINEFNTATKDKKVTFTTGVGNHQMQTYQFIKSQYPNKVISSGSLGVMGVGLPYAIGVQIANPNNMVILIDGDSSFNMTLSDLKTIKEYNLPVKIAIMNNSAQMMVTVWEELYFEGRNTATINNNNPCYTTLANSFGIKSISCDNRSNLVETIDQFVNYTDGPILCEFKIERDICLPLVGPGCSLDDMILPKEQMGSNNINLTKGLAPS
jgi:acetolactate synthase-1/2/3 large subunit